MADQHHVLVVREPIDEDHVPQCELACPGVSDDCRAWRECQEPGCPPFEPDTAAAQEAEGAGEFEAHGVWHGWPGSGPGLLPEGWCYPARHEELHDAAVEMFGGQPPPGRYPVTWETDWRGEQLALRRVEEEVSRRG